MEKTNGKRLKLASLGDSITYGFIPRNSPGYPGQLESYACVAARLLDMDFFNAGINDSTLAAGPGSFEPMCERFSTLPEDADIVTVMGGTNDIRQGIPLGTVNDRSADTYCGALHRICEGLYRNYFIGNGTETGKDKRIVLLTPVKLMDAATGELTYGLEAFADAVREIGAYYSFPVLDFYRLSYINPHICKTVQGWQDGYDAMYNLYISYGTHPTQEGALIMGRLLANFIRTLL